MKRIISSLFVAALVSSSASAQVPAQVPMPIRGVTDAQVFFFLQNLPPESAKPLGSVINALLSDTAGHMRMAESRVPTAGDSLRAAAVVASMHASLSQYADVAAAERDGYVMMMPWLEEQVIYHYNNMRNAGAARTAFDATRPTSLLYRKNADGRKILVGAMYTAPATSTAAELDARLPLGIAHWHQHVNFCVMRPNVAVEGLATSDSTRFAKWLAIETPDACTAAGGLFVPQLFGWMAHVIAFDPETTDPWGGHGRDHMGMHHGH